MIRNIHTWPLTKTQRRELKRRIKEIDDPRRWAVCSKMPGLKKRGFYYLVDSHGYTMEPLRATLFKKREIAVAVGDALDGLRKNKGREAHKIVMIKIPDKK